jgi:hypothetical protein
MASSMLNLPPQPGPIGALLLALGALAGFAVVLCARRGIRDRLGQETAPAVVWLVTAALGLTVAGAPFTTWRVLEDIRETAPISPEHARYVGAETKLIDGELAERIGFGIRKDETYYVAVAPSAHGEIRASLALWLGYALAPRRRTADPRNADWIVTWGAPPASLGLDAGTPILVGRNRLVDFEPVFVARSRS